MGDTFLTQPDLPEPEGMTRVREEHSRLQGVVFSLNKRISQVLAKQEGDFLAAYRAHMYTVQKELQTLRQRVIEAENVLQVWSTVRIERRYSVSNCSECSLLIPAQQQLFLAGDSVYVNHSDRLTTVPASS